MSERANRARSDGGVALPCAFASTARIVIAVWLALAGAACGGICREEHVDVRDDRALASLAKCEEVGIVTITLDGTREIRLPKLRSARQLRIYKNATVRSIAVPRLRKLSGLYLENNPALESFVAPQLVRVTHVLYARRNPLLATLHMPALETVAAGDAAGSMTTHEFHVQDNPQLARLSLPELQPLTVRPHVELAPTGATLDLKEETRRQFEAARLEHLQEAVERESARAAAEAERKAHEASEAREELATRRAGDALAACVDRCLRPTVNCFSRFPTGSNCSHLPTLPQCNARCAPVAFR